MDINIEVLLGSISKEAIEFWNHSFIIAALKFFLFVYTFVLLVNIVILFILRGISGDWKKIRYGTSERPAQKSAVVKRWDGIVDRLKSESVSQYKVAILEADALADDVLMDMGFGGENMAEKLEHVWGGQLESKELLKEAHEIRNRIVHEENFDISREETEKWLGNYKKFFEELELF